VKIEGTVVEMGDLDGMTAPGIRVESGDQLLSISGLTRAQLAELPPVLFRNVVLTLESHAAAGGAS
jgi:hypothetical protein